MKLPVVQKYNQKLHVHHGIPIKKSRVQATLT